MTKGIIKMLESNVLVNKDTLLARNDKKFNYLTRLNWKDKFGVIGSKSNESVVAQR